MKNKISWYEKYHLALKENLSVREIMKLRECGQPKALEIRYKVIEYCLMNEIEISSNKVPTEIVMLVTNRDLKYYYDKMTCELKAINMQKGLTKIMK